MLVNVDAHAIIMVYDISNETTFSSIEEYWHKEVENYSDPEALLVLLGRWRLM